MKQLPPRTREPDHERESQLNALNPGPALNIGDSLTKPWQEPRQRTTSHQSDNNRIRGKVYFDNEQTDVPLRHGMISYLWLHSITLLLVPCKTVPLLFFPVLIGSLSAFKSYHDCLWSEAVWNLSCDTFSALAVFIISWLFQVMVAPKRCFTTPDKNTFSKLIPRSRSV